MSSADLGLPEAHKQQLLTWVVMESSCKRDIHNQKISFNGRIQRALTTLRRCMQDIGALKDDATIQCYLDTGETKSFVQYIPYHDLQRRVSVQQEEYILLAS